MEFVLKILFFVLAIFHADISEAKAIVLNEVVSEINFAFNQTENKSELTIISGNELDIRYKNENNLVDYRNWTISNKRMPLRREDVYFGQEAMMQ